jgi:uncharacterized protein YjiS (DUF1127 family)
MHGASSDGLCGQVQHTPDQPSLRSRPFQIFVAVRDEVCRLVRLRVHAEFRCVLNEMSPVQIDDEKYFCFVFAENMVLSAIPPRAEGRTRRHER